MDANFINRVINCLVNSITTLSGEKPTTGKPYLKKFDDREFDLCSFVEILLNKDLTGYICLTANASSIQTLNNILKLDSPMLAFRKLVFLFYEKIQDIDVLNCSSNREPLILTKDQTMPPYVVNGYSIIVPIKINQIDIKLEINLNPVT